jgi:asparagine synthase (glutamine-hydrolysing)
MNDVEEPVAHEAAPAFHFVSKLARDHVKVALSGQGADEPWAGYGRYVGVNLSTVYSRLPVGLTEAVGRLVGRIPLPSERIKRGAAALGERDLVLRFVKIYSFFSSDMKQMLFKGAMRRDLVAAPYAPADAIRHLQREVAHLDPLTQILYMDARLSLPDDLLMVGDKTSMANSIEVRVPYLDRRLVEFVESLPPDLKLRGLTAKYLHKKALLKWLSREDVYRRKKGFANPIGQWLRTSMRPLVEDCLLSRESMISTYFDQDYIRQIVDADRGGRGAFTRHIYLLLSLELWHRTFMR